MNVIELGITASGSDIEVVDRLKQMTVRIQRRCGKVETHIIQVDPMQEGTTYLATLHPGDFLIYVDQ